MLLIFLDVARVCLRSPTLWTFTFSDLFIHFFLSVSTWKNDFSSPKCKDDVIVQIRDGSEGGGGVHPLTDVMLQQQFADDKLKVQLPPDPQMWFDSSYQRAAADQWRGWKGNKKKDKSSSEFLWIFVM